MKRISQGTTPTKEMQKNSLLQKFAASPSRFFSAKERDAQKNVSNFSLTALNKHLTFY